MAGQHVAHDLPHRLEALVPRVHQLHIIGGINLQQRALRAVVFGLHRHCIVGTQPGDASAIAGVGHHFHVARQRFDHPDWRALQRFAADELVAPLRHRMADHVAVGEIGADEGILLATGRQPPHLLQRRQIDPDIVISALVLDGQHGGPGDIGRRAEAHEPAVVHAIRLQFGDAAGLSDAGLAGLVGQYEPPHCQ